MSIVRAELPEIDREHARGVVLVLVAGVFWSSAGIVIRVLEGADGWQILFYRSLGLIVTLLAFIAWRSRGRVADAVVAAGWPGVAGGLCLTLAFTSMIFGILHTHVANVLFILSAAPFVAALLGRVILGERVAPRTWACMTLALVGVGVMVGESLGTGGLLGNVIALGTTFGFAGFTIALRLGRSADMFPAVCLGGCFALVVAALMAGDLVVSGRDLVLCLFLGVCQIGLGLICYTFGSRHLPAVEATLLSLTEVVLGPLWVWVGVGETPTLLTLAGGGVVLAAVVWQALAGTRRPRAPVGVA